MAQPTASAPRPQPPQLQPQQPTLPYELIQLIFEQLGLTLTQPTPTSWRTNHSSHFERTFRSLTFLRPLHSFARSVLFSSAHIGTEDRAKSFTKALDQSFLHPAFVDEDGVRQPATRERGYLRQLVKGVRVDILERKNSKNPGAKGVSPQAVRKLAAALPELGTLDISCSDKGGWLDGEMIRALREWKKVQSMEIQGTGWGNAAAVFGELDGSLRDLKLRALAHGFTDVLTSVDSNAAFLSLPPSPTPTLFASNLTTLVLIRVSLDPFTTLPYLFSTSGLNPCTLLHLTLSKLVGPPSSTIPSSPSFALDPISLQSSLLPFVPYLHSFHLDLFDVPPITSRSAREELQAQGLYRNGQLVLPDSNHRPATFLAPSLGEELRSLTVGGPMNVHGAQLFDKLCDSPARIKELVLTQCAQNSSKALVGGLTPEEFIAALDTEWSTALERVDIKGMEQTFYDDEMEEVEAWGWEAVEAIEAKLKEVERARGEGGRRIELIHAVARPVGAMGGKRGREDGGEDGKKGKKKGGQKK